MKSHFFEKDPMNLTSCVSFRVSDEIIKYKVDKKYLLYTNTIWFISLIVFFILLYSQSWPQP